MKTELGVTRKYKNTIPKSLGEIEWGKRKGKNEMRL
jgi:hypothetical protein